jgi:two-component system, OmpR family, sensor histidine kinase SenX3
LSWLSSILRQTYGSTKAPRAFSIRSPLFFWIPVLSGIGILLFILGTLQYRWSTQIKKVSEVRVGADLESVMIKWHLDFYGEFSNVCVALQIGPDSGERDSWEDYLHRYARWGRPMNRETAPDQLYTNRDLVEEIYIWETSRRTDPRLLRLDADNERIETSAVPSELHPLLAHLQNNSANLQVALRAWEVGGSETGTLPEPQEPPSPSYSLRSNSEAGWQFDERIPALVHPIFHYTHHGAFDTKALSSSDPVDWVVVVLSQETIQERILPGLMQRYFSGSQGLEYKLAVIAEGKAPRVLYSSDPGFGAQLDSTSDAVMNIFGPPPGSATADLLPIQQNATALSGADWHRFSSPVWFPVIQKTSSDGPWALVLQNRHGRFDAAVTRVWRSNLLTGGVLLLLLAASMVLVVVASQHAQKLANLQMDFVASVSHELRTPLTVILSAGENVRDGLPEGRSAFMEQGSVITDQANQLMELVDQVLRFAATAKGAGRPDLSPIQVGVLVESALQNTADLVQRAAFRVEKRIPGDLPNVVGEMSGLVQSLQNLIINAVKYSDRDRWIGISAGTGTDSNGRREVRISVADHGTGIASSELTQIFEPFYRSPHAISGQVRGTGLGLAIAKRHAEGCGGRLSVVSEVGVGSVFTLHLPADEEDSILTPLVPEAKTRFHQ